MRVWDVPVTALCRQHLLGEHREIHTMWTALTREGAGYANHRETVRWRDHLRALHTRHESLASEMQRRGYRHVSPLADVPAHLLTRTSDAWPPSIDAPDVQVERIRAKRCVCCIDAWFGAEIPR